MKMKKVLGILTTTALVVSLFSGCGKQESKDTEKAAMTDEERILSAAKDGKVGNWGLGNEYEIQALLTKYGKSTDYLVQSFDMDGFDDDSITLASAMTYNELGLVVNDYEGGYGYGDTVGTIDMNDQGVAMLEDNIFCTKEFAKNNPNTVKAFLSASLKGWEYACENPDEAAQIVFEAGSSVSTDHQKYIARRYRAFFLQGSAIFDNKDCKKIYEALMKGDPKLRTYRALYQQLYGRYIDEAKKGGI